ncbi:hypothetical protein Ddye_023119 [Dipteronia dyeriana]|uniref:Leucine-rich repeat-containing N-terminal plant-type domain-containing protein n=1 Tax=Dipteronia dyeriana TaxID=168575 RepID=A0AAD9WSA4_9ROSI|nr:hypothetical protein Ddye_023119 [Dipteronia dyeriana]
MFSSISYPAILPWCFSLLLINSFCTIFKATVNPNETDHLALLSIKAQLHDPLGVMGSWNNSVPLCLWTGVSCGHRHQRVTKLDLRSQSLEGRLSPSIGTLPTNLSHCSNLIVIDFHKNNLVGEIPVQIGYLLKLEHLHADINHLSGPLPASIGNLSNLLVIGLSENSLGGRVPDKLGQLRRLERVNLYYNNFSGMVPASIYNVSSLERLYFSRNRLSGSLPPNIGFTLQNLKHFVITHNYFTGSLPDSLSNASHLEIIDIAKNSFSGKVSIDFSGLNNIYWINMAGNNLGTGTTDDLGFVTSLINCSKFAVFSLNKNQFGGVLPRSITNLSTTIIRISIGSNRISGTIPPGIGNLVNLTGIGMEDNQISGTIPHVIERLSGHTSAERLYYSFSGHTHAERLMTYTYVERPQKPTLIITGEGYMVLL